jgi:hypothetical protein
MTLDQRPLRIANSGSFELPVTPDEAFDLFTAEGERLWVPGWSPAILGTLPQHPGLVFLTEADGRQTIWTVIESDRAALRHVYSRVTPGQTAALVEVRLHPSGTGSRIDVSYDLTALSEEGEAALDAFADPHFGAMMDKWRSLAAAMLAGRDPAAS